MRLNPKNPFVIFCALAVAATAATAAFGQGPLLPIPTQAPSKIPTITLDDATRTAINEREYLRRAAGLTGLRGPGVIVLLRDRKGAKSKDVSKPIPGLVHDYDLSAVVNQLRAADAEAIAINGTRMGSQTAISVSGPSIYVGGQKMSNPFKIEAIGDAGKMKNNLTEIATELKNIGPYLSVTTSKDVRVAALTQAPEFRFGKPE